MLPYQIDFRVLREKLKEMKAEKVLLQIPEGMRIYVSEIADRLRDFQVFISTEPCYGACDIEIYPDMVTVQFGHAEIPNIKYPENIIFVEAYSQKSFKSVVRKFLKSYKFKKIGIVASVQHIPAIEEVKEIMEKDGREVFVGEGDSRVKYNGQVLGCNFSCARSVEDDVEVFAFLGSGDFHAMGVRISADKRTIVLNPFTNEIRDVEKIADLFVRQRFGAIVKAEKGEKFGIIVGTKIGQRRVKLALALKEMIESTGRKAYLLSSNNVIPENFYYDVDVLVNTSCPRITYDDYLRFPKPIVSPIELEIALKFKLWENFSFDEIVDVD